jgi:hypothetical protein
MSDDITVLLDVLYYSRRAALLHHSAALLVHGGRLHV